MIFYDEEGGEKSPDHPRAGARLWSILTFGWAFGLIKRAWRQGLKLGDIYKVLDWHKAEKLGPVLEKTWNKELQKENPSLGRALVKVHGVPIAFSWVLCLFFTCFVNILQIYIMKWFIASFSSEREFKARDSLVLALSHFGMSTLLTVCANSFQYVGQIAGMKMEVALSFLIYKKVLRLPATGNQGNGASDANESNEDSAAGKIVNLLSNDLALFIYSLVAVPYILAAPVQFAILAHACWQHMGPATLGGMLFILVTSAQSWILGAIFGSMRAKSIRASDARANLMHEVIMCIRTIKLNAWEFVFQQKIEETRRKELDVMRLRNTYRVYGNMMEQTGFKLVYLAVIAPFVLGGGVLEAENVFFVMSACLLIRYTMGACAPNALFVGMETLIAIRRLQEFLTSPEIVVQEWEIQDNKTLDVSDLCAKHDPSSSKLCLDHCNFALPNKELCLVVGRVGSGKTTLLNVLAGELHVHSGEIRHGGKICFVPQQPWIFSSTVRKNILFGQPMDEDKYGEVVRACSLDHDFSTWENGDSTMVGERGVALSGGQMARIGLARAVYRHEEYDTYLLDDPLSAVDQVVGSHIFEHCVRGLLRDKTVVMTTHNHAYLDKADRILVMDSGGVEYFGEMSLGSRGKFKQMMCSLDRSPSGSESSNEGKVEKFSENQEEGKVGWETYINYFKSSRSSFRVAWIFMLAIFTQILFVLVDALIGFWIENTRVDPNKPKDRTNKIDPLFIISSLSLTLLVMLLATEYRNHEFFQMTIDCSTVLHNKMFWKIMRAPVKFFDSHPVGIVLTRFTQDLAAIDENMPPMMLECLTIFLSIVGVLTTASIYTYYLIIPSVALLLLFFALMTMFLATSRPLMRLQGITSAPVYSQLSSTMEGLKTIRALRVQDTLLKDFERQKDINTSSHYLFHVTLRIFMGVTQHLINMYTFSVMLIFTWLQASTVAYLGSNVGVVLMSTSFIVTEVTWAMMQALWLECCMTSVERVLEYGQLDSEGRIRSKKFQKWPIGGEVHFEGVSLSYSKNEVDDGNKVLNGVSFRVKEGERIGIVGRTGAGKSSLAALLLRMVEPCGGRIFVDGLDIGAMGLHEVRRAIALIPQKAELMAGTIRSNLDPEGKFTSGEIWEAMKKVHYANSKEDLDKILEYTIAAGGTNLSDGQRQLICLARAILKRSKIIVLDEATANIDPKTDDLIQQTIRDEMSGSTVLVIAHRLNSVLKDSDRILVMEDGRVREFDSPGNLLANPHSYLSNLVSGRSETTKL